MHYIYIYTIKILTMCLKSQAELRQIWHYSGFCTNGPSQGKAAHDGNWKYLNENCAWDLLVMLVICSNFNQQKLFSS